MDIREQNKEKLRIDAESMRSLNFSEAYIAEVIENTAKWVGTGLLTGVDSPYVSRQLAALLENQVLFNTKLNVENITAGDPADAQYIMDPEAFLAHFKRISIPAIRRVFDPNSFVGYDLVSVQVMREATESIYFTNDYDRQVAETISAKTRKMRTNINQALQPSQMWSDVNEEADVVANFSQDIQNEINREIVSDLLNNSATKAQKEWDGPDNLLEWVDALSSTIGAKTGGRDGTWVVASSDVIDALEETEALNIGTRLSAKDEYSVRIGRVGTLAKPNGGNWDLFEMHHPKSKVLVGHKNEGNHYASGYFYSPYAPLACRPAWGLPDGAHSHGSTFSRYGKKMWRDGSNYYALLDLDKMPELLKDEPKQEED